MMADGGDKEASKCSIGRGRGGSVVMERGRAGCEGTLVGLMSVLHLLLFGIMQADDFFLSTLTTRVPVNAIMPYPLRLLYGCATLRLCHQTGMDVVTVK